MPGACDASPERRTSRRRRRESVARRPRSSGDPRRGGRRVVGLGAPAAPPGGAAGEIALYGHIRSLARTGSRFQLRFDPAWWLGGVTANRAAIEDGAIPPGDVVPNDYYIRDETHRLLTFRVAAGARARVLVLRGGQISSTAISVAELAQIVAGRNPRRRPLYDRGNHLGFWIRARTDTVRSFDQQYQP